MELIDDTTILELPNRIKSLNISPETHIHVIIEPKNTLFYYRIMHRRNL